MEIPKLRVRWLRGGASANIDFERPKTTLGLGGRGSGKSCFLETIATKYQKTIDIFGSRDNEGLAWLRCPLYSKNEILLTHGDSVELSGKWDAHKVRELTLKDIERYRITTSVSGFYGSLDEEFSNLNDLIFKVLYRRTHWKTQINILIREASNFLYSRIRVTRNQTIAKSDFLYLLREGRHAGYPCGVDTIRWTSLDKEVRDTADYLVIKSVGILGLPRDLRFLYRYVEPYGLMDPHPSTFVIVTKRGAIGVGTFPFPSWHKIEKEDLLDVFKLKPEYGEIPRTGKEDARNIVGDFEHHNIIEKRIKGVFGEGRKRSMRRIMDAVHRSVQTIHSHIKDHNEQVKKQGYCERCRRIKSPHASVETETPR
ncbi:hypothetical protein ES702_06781 [subsurface metagenome]